MSDLRGHHYDEDDVVRSGDGRGSIFSSIVSERVSRRGLLKAGLIAGVGTGLMACEPAKAGSKTPLSPTGLDFEPIAPSTAETLMVSAGYEAEVVLRWGDPMARGVPGFVAGAITPDAQAKSFGYNNDFVGYLPLPFGSDNSTRGLLAVNHEYVNPELMFPIKTPAEQTKEQTDVVMNAVGFSVTEVELVEGKWRPIRSSKYNKRWTAFSRMEIAGPARGDSRMKTKEHPTGTTCTGTFSNCSAGKTPWGTVLSGEENFQDMYAHAETITDPTEKRSAERYGLSKKDSEYAWEKSYERFDCRSKACDANHLGWVVEIDPFDPEWTPRKRTALGRCRHEAATTHVTRSGHVVMYTGDDARFEYVYKFVSVDRFDEKDRKKNRDLMDDGTLYVAKFNPDGSGEWLPLVHGQGPLTAANGFRNQADVVIDVRIAADLVGATKMDRPEDIEVNPVNEKVYIVCTNNVDRGTEGRAAPDASNPRAENRHGHIIELMERSNDHRATSFVWELFMVCGDPDDEATFFAGYDKTELSPISCPDNICFDAQGNLWIATDGMERSMKLRDGFFAVPTEGPERGKLKQFMATVIGSEVCGPEFTPDGKTAFLAIQHPGEGSLFTAPSTQFPDGTGVPRPSVIAIRAKNGGVIGSRG